MLRIVGEFLESNVIKGFGRNFVNVDYNTHDAAMLTRITRDTWTFASAKNYQQLRDMTLALVNDNGQARTFAEFAEAALTINEKYNKSWLLTEYNQALGASTMAARWNDYEKNADAMPYLRYQTVGDDRVRDSHRALDGVTRKIDDGFWNTYYPPNGWGCRCDVIQMPGSKYTETAQTPTAPVPDMFRTNLAKTGLVYPKGHPYYDGVPEEVLRKSLHYLPADAPYRKVQNNLEMHLLHGTDEMQANIHTARILAKNGHKVKLLPILNDDVLRENIYGTTNYVSGKNPDALVNNKITELKQASTKSSIHNAIERGQLQADVVIIRVDNMDNATAERYVKGKMKQALFIDEVWTVTQQNINIYTREGLGLGQKAKR